MEKLKECFNKKRRQGGEEKQSPSSCNVAKNENPVEGTMTELERMYESKDASVLFRHFPEEIWLLITDKVVDSETLTNLMRASAVFRNLLLPRRVEFLFPQVWQVLGLKFETNDDGVYCYDIEYPHWRAWILRFREVCKSWCQGVDEFYEDLPEQYRMQLDRDIEYEPGNKSVGDWTSHQRFSGDVASVQHFMNHFDLTHFLDGSNQRNPIINRIISISLKKEDHKSGILILLEKYGHHFWHCELYISDYFPTWITFYTDLKELLDLLPNLKTLKVMYYPVNPVWDQQRRTWVRRFKSTSEMDIRQLEQEIASHPLPKLHKLHFLSVTNFPSLIFKALVSANNHISMLEVRGDDEGYDFYSFPMPNLKQLSVEYFSKAEFENLNKLEVNWSLEQIYLNLRECPFMPRSQILSLLEAKWADTLTNVAILTPSTTAGSSDRINIKDDGSSTLLNLPKVERFLFSTQEISSLDFILPMKRLKILQVALPKETQFDEATVKPLRLIQKNQIVQIVGYFYRFHRSNIWNLFPNLKIFQLGDAGLERTCFGVTYTRKDYENSGKGRNENLWYS